ncbi:MAG TPA: mannonate dehydratase [Acidobacteriaceae bacterium]|nr:mannonate dehydratase [Acidobacteriaceae bacterium]
MLKPNRREYIQGVLATMAAAAVSPAALASSEPQPIRKAAADGKQITISLIWGAQNPHLVKLSQQIGVTHAIAGTAGILRNLPRAQYVDAVARMKAEYEAAGLKIAAIESHPVMAEKIKLGLPGRDEEIQNYIAAIEALGKVGIDVVCYDFMAGIDWYRSNTDVPFRGGSSTMSFDAQDAEKQGPTKWGHITTEQMWSNIEYFQKAVIPVAEKAGVKMALHPDDPPVPELRGIARIITSADAYRRVMKIVPSPVNGVTFEMSVFYLMGENIKALAREWCRENKVFYIHARNVRGKRDHFIETFQDDGAIDFGEMFQTFYDNGFRGPLRPDHDPILDAETDVHPGYGVLGKIFGVGYIKGVMESRHIPYV